MSTSSGPGSARAQRFGWLTPSRLAAVCIPLAAYFAIASLYWADAPAWDDYGPVLDAVLRMMDATTAREWLGIVTSQHNEHRVAVLRLVSRALAAFGAIDFRVLALIGNLAFIGVFALIVAEFREGMPALLLAAAGLLMFQLSYFEASVWASGGVTNMGSALFGFASLALALRPGAMSAAGCIVFALLGTGSSANGLLVLPLAAVACAVMGMRRRAWVLALVGAALWAGYFASYARPSNHPSPLVAFDAPLETAKLFLIVVGSVVPGHVRTMLAGAALLGLLGWLTWKRAWRSHPVAALWIAFLILTAAAAAAGRVGVAVLHAPRYAIYSTCLLVIALLGVHEVTRPWSRRRLAGVAAAAAGVSILVTALSWRDFQRFAIEPFLLARVEAAPGAQAATRYFGIHFPYPDIATTILLASERRGLYVPRTVTVHPSSVQPAGFPLPSARHAGNVDEISVTGAEVFVRGWTDIPATVVGRRFLVASRADAPRASQLVVTDRANVARYVHDPRLVFSGFVAQLAYESDQQAREAAASLCIAVEAPGEQAAVLIRAAVDCARSTP